MHDKLHNHFTEASREILRDGVRSWKALQKHADWCHWQIVGKAIVEGHEAAAKAIGSTSGRAFNQFMAELYGMATYLGDFVDIDKRTRSHAAKCWRERDGITAFRQQIGQAKALTLNHPTAVLRAFEAWKRPSEREHKPLTPETAMTKLMREHAKLIEDHDKLKKDRQGEVSFTLRDTATDIAQMIISSVGDERAEEVAEAIRRQRGKRVRSSPIVRAIVGALAASFLAPLAARHTGMGADIHFQQHRIYEHDGR